MRSRKASAVVDCALSRMERGLDRVLIVEGPRDADLMPWAGRLRDGSKCDPEAMGASICAMRRMRCCMAMAVFALSLLGDKLKIGRDHRMALSKRLCGGETKSSPSCSRHGRALPPRRPPGAGARRGAMGLLGMLPTISSDSLIRGFQEIRRVCRRCKAEGVQRRGDRRGKRREG